MNKALKISLIILLIFVVLGFIGYFSWTQFALSQDKSKEQVLVLTTPTPTEIIQDPNANITPTTTPSLISKTGSFNQIDFQHKGSGEVKLVEENGLYFVEFQENFQVVNGPDLYVYLSQNQDFKNQAAGGLDTAKTINIGKLDKISGKQRYQITKETFEDYDAAVVIWCKAFGVQFSRADLL